MTEVDCFVLDTNVISSFYAVGWLSGLETWHSDYEIVAPERIWAEVQDYWSLDPPEWLQITSVDLEGAEDDHPGSISLPDWSCVILAESVEQRCIVTNDQGIRSVAKRRETPCIWGTRYLISTFERCGISEAELDDGQEEYADDLGLSNEVIEEIEGAEKP